VAEREFDAALAVSTAAVQALLLAAEAAGAQLHVDLARIDSVDARADAGRVQAATLALPTRGLQPLSSFPANGLNSLRTPGLLGQAQASSDGAFEAEAGPTCPSVARVEALKQRLQAMSDRSTQAMREKTELNEEIDRLRLQMSRLAAAQQDVDVVKAEAAARISATTATADAQVGCGCKR